MALVEWNDRYSVGIEYLDNQHKGLIVQINVLHAAMEVGKANEHLVEILDTLLAYASTHFKTEEDLFEKYGFPESDDHISEHDFFAKEVLSFKDHFINGRPLVSFEVLAFLKNWILKHMLVCDMVYRDYFQSKGIVI